MSASRAGRNAEPVSSDFLTAIRRSMISPRLISRPCISSSMRSISTRSLASDGSFWRGGFGIVVSRQSARLIGVVKPEIKENIDLGGDGPIYAPLIAGPALEHDPEKWKPVFG